MATDTIVPDLGTELDAGQGGILGDLGAADTVDTADADVSSDSEQINAVDQQEQPQNEQQKATDEQRRRDQQRTAVTKYLRELRGNDQLKDVAEALNKAYFRNEEIEKLGDIKGLRDLKQQIDLLGGPDSLSHFRDLEMTVENIDRMLDQGDPQVIEDMFSESPEGMKKLMPVALDKMKAIDPAKYAEVLRPHVASAIQQTNFSPTVSQSLNLIAKAYEAKDPEHVRFYLEQAHAQMKGISDWLGGLGAEDGTKAVQAAVQTPKSQESPNLLMEVQRQLIPWAKTEIQNALKPFIGKGSVTDAKMNDLITLVASEMDRRLATDEIFQRNLEAWQRTGKSDRVLKHSQNGISSVLSDSVRAVWERSGASQARNLQQGNQTSKPSQATNQERKKVSQARPIMVAKKPSMDQLDMNRDPERLLFISHRGYLKDGRLVQWK